MAAKSRRPTRVALRCVAVVALVSALFVVYQLSRMVHRDDTLRWELANEKEKAKRDVAAVHAEASRAWRRAQEAETALAALRRGSPEPPTAAPELRRRAALAALAPCSAGEAQACRVVAARGPRRRATGGTASPATVDAAARAAVLADVVEPGKGGALRPARRDLFAAPRRGGDARCEATARLPLADALAAFAADATRRSERARPRVAFTVADGHYAAGLADHALDVSRAYGASTPLLVVALDDEAAAAACAAGAAVARFEAAEKDGTGARRRKKAAVYAAKYGTMASLLRAGLDVTFGEMDVFLIGDPLAAASCAGEACSEGLADPADADVVIGAHQDNCAEFNAGWYHARSKHADVAALFEDLDRYTAAHPKVFDQQVLNCMLKRALATPGHHRHECETRGGNSKSALGASNDTILRPWTTPPHRVSFSVLGGDVLAAHPQPFVLPPTVGIHVLTNTPLTDARAKTDVARELGMWPGADGYYAVGGGAPKYLVYANNLLSTSDEPRYHSMTWLVAALCHLVFLARVTGRVLVLPTIFDFQQFHYAADHFDLRSVEAFLGGERSWRESTFFSNARLDVAPDATTATLAVTRDGRAALPPRNLASVTATASDLAPLATAADAPPPPARSYDLGGKAADKVRDVWAVAAADAALAAADVLVVDLDGAGPLPLQECVRRGVAWDCGRAVDVGEAPRELALALGALKWCRQQPGIDHARAPNGGASPPGYAPGKTCAARLANKRIPLGAARLAPVPD